MVKFYFLSYIFVTKENEPSAGNMVISINNYKGFPVMSLTKMIKDKYEYKSMTIMNFKEISESEYMFMESEYAQVNI